MRRAGILGQGKFARRDRQRQVQLEILLAAGQGRRQGRQGDQYTGDRSFLFIEYCFHSSESFGLLQAVSLVFVVVEVVLRVGDLRVGNGVVAVARFDEAGRRIELQRAIVAVARHRIVPDAPAHQIVLALEFAEELPRPFVANLLFQACGRTVDVVAQSGARAGHVEVLDRLLVVFFVEVALGHHQQRVGVAEYLVIVAVGRCLHVRAPEFRTAPGTGVGAVEGLVFIAPRHVVFGADILAHLGLESLTEVDVRPHGRPYGRLIAEFGNVDAVVDGRVGRTRIGLADAGHVGGIGETALRVGVLNLHDGFGSVLVAEEDVLGVVVLRQGAVDGLDLLQRFEGSVPLLVPHGHFGDEHVGAGGSQPVGLVVVGASLVDERRDRLQVFDYCRARFVGIHARQHLNAVEYFVVGDVVEVLDGSKVPQYYGGWYPSMNSLIGNIGIVESVTRRDEHSMAVSLKNHSSVFDSRGLLKIGNGAFKLLTFYESTFKEKKDWMSL